MANELVLKQRQHNQKPTLEEIKERAELTERIDKWEMNQNKFGLPEEVLKSDDNWNMIANQLRNMFAYYNDSNRGLGFYFTSNYWEGKYSAEHFAYSAVIMWERSEYLLSVVKDMQRLLSEQEKNNFILSKRKDEISDELMTLIASVINDPGKYKDTDPVSKMPLALAVIRGERKENKERIFKLEVELDEKKMIAEIETVLEKKGEEEQKLLDLLKATEDNLVKLLQENKGLSNELSEKKGEAGQLKSLFKRGLEKIRKIGQIVTLNTKNKDESNTWEQVEDLDYLDKLEKKVADLIKEKKQTEETLNAGIKKFNHLDEEKKILKEENDTIKEKWVALEKKLTNSEKEKIELVSQLSEENRSLNNQLTNSWWKNDNLTTENNGLKAELDQALKDLPMMKGMIEDEIHRITGIRDNIAINEKVELSELEKKFGGALLSEIPADKTLDDVYKWSENLRQKLEETKNDFNNTLIDKDKIINGLEANLNLTKTELEENQRELTAAKRQADLLLWQSKVKENELSESWTENWRLEGGKFNLKRALKIQKREQETINKKLQEDLQNNLKILANKDKTIDGFKVNFEKTKEHFQGIIDRDSKTFNIINANNGKAIKGLKLTLKKKTKAHKEIISGKDRWIKYLHETIVARPEITHDEYNNLVNERNNLEIEQDYWQRKWNEETTNHQATQQKLTETAAADSQLKIDLAQVQSDFQQEQKGHLQTQEKLTILVEQHNNCPRKHRKEITEEINQQLELNLTDNELTFEQLITRIKELIRGPVNSIKQDTIQLCQALKISLSPEIRGKLEKESQHEELINLRNEIVKSHLAQQNMTASGAEKSQLSHGKDEWWITFLLISSLIITWLTIFYLVRKQKLRNK